MGKKINKSHVATLQPAKDSLSEKVKVDDSARLREIRLLVERNNKSTLDSNLVICQIYMESRFDAHAEVAHNAKGLMQMQTNAVKQVFQYRKEKEIGRKVNKIEQDDEFSKGKSFHDSEKMFDEGINIQIGTEYMQHWLDVSGSVEQAYIKYRGLYGRGEGVYYKKIKSCADKLVKEPNSMQSLLDMVKTK